MKAVDHLQGCPESLMGEHHYEKMIALGAETATILDLGCGDGVQTEKLLMLRPQRVFGVDPSEDAIHEAQKRFGSRADFRVLDTNQLTFPDNRFDLVVGRHILARLDFEPAIREIQRVLRHGGMAIFLEHLLDGPFARLARLFYSEVRRLEEVPVSREKVDWANRQFGAGEHYYFHLVSVPASVLGSLFSREPESALTRWAYRVDRLLARTPLRHWMRSVVLVWTKAKDPRAPV